MHYVLLSYLIANILLFSADSMTYMWGMTFGKDVGIGGLPLSPSSKIVSMSFAFLALVFVNHYAANLMASLLYEETTLPITGIRDERVSL